MPQEKTTIEDLEWVRMSSGPVDRPNQTERVKSKLLENPMVPLGECILHESLYPTLIDLKHRLPSEDADKKKIFRANNLHQRNIALGSALPDPFSPFFKGLLVTTGFLSWGLYSFRKGNTRNSQLAMRGRVLAQGFTLVALVYSFTYSVRKEAMQKAAQMKTASE